MDNVNVLVNEVAIAQELQTSPPVSFAATTSRSLDVQEVLAGGKVCPNDFTILSKLNSKKATVFFEKMHGHIGDIRFFLNVDCIDLMKSGSPK